MRLHREMQHYGASRDTPESTPLMSVATRPEISPFGVMSLGMTANATIDLSGTLDPENDTLECWVLTTMATTYLSNLLAIDHIKSFLYLRRYLYRHHRGE